MGLNSEIPVSDFGYSGVAQCLRLAVTPANAGGEVTVGKLPRGAMVVGGGVQVYEAFAAGALKVTGQPGDVDVLASVDLTTVAFTAIDPGKFFSADELAITATIEPPPDPPAQTTAGAFAPDDEPGDPNVPPADAPPAAPVAAREWAQAQLAANAPAETAGGAAPGAAFIAVLFIPPKTMD